MTKDSQHILVVDDDVFLRLYLEERLGLSGFRVTLAENGADALCKFQQSPVDLVLTDIVMPDAEGLEFIKAIRLESPDTPVIAMSGYARGDAYLRVAQLLGAKHLLKKPFTAQELMVAIHAELGEDGASAP